MDTNDARALVAEARKLAREQGRMGWDDNEDYDMARREAEALERLADTLSAEMDRIERVRAVISRLEQEIKYAETIKSTPGMSTFGKMAAEGKQRVAEDTMYQLRNALAPALVSTDAARSGGEGNEHE